MIGAESTVSNPTGLNLGMRDLKGTSSHNDGRRIGCAGGREYPTAGGASLKAPRNFHNTPSIRHITDISTVPGQAKRGAVVGMYILYWAISPIPE